MEMIAIFKVSWIDNQNVLRLRGHPGMQLDEGAMDVVKVL